MKDIFTDLYNKVLGFFHRTEALDNSKDVARNRLRVVLMQDRTNLNPQLLERMRKELVELLSRYVEMDKEALELNLEQDGEQMALMLSIPVIRAKDEEEIERELAEEEIGKREEEEIETDSETNEEGEAVEEDETCDCGEVCDCGDDCDCGCQSEPEVEEVKEPEVKPVTAKKKSK